MEMMRAESDRQYTIAAAESTQQQIASDTSAAAIAANRPGLIEILGRGDSRKGSLVAALVRFRKRSINVVHNRADEETWG